MVKLLEEAFPIVNHYIPSLKLETVAGWILNAIEKSPTIFDSTLVEAMNGLDPENLITNQRIVNQGKLLFGIDCQKHRWVIEYVLAKTEKRRLLIHRWKKPQWTKQSGDKKDRSKDNKS
jgi:hypothetical protein